MSRLLVTFMYLLVVLFIDLFQATDVKVKIDAPAEVTAGSEFEVRVTVDKGDIEIYRAA